MPVRVLVNGAPGKMGRLACEAINDHPDFNLVASLSRQNDLKQAISNTKAQIVIDLTRADSVYENSLIIIDSGAHPVIGTSGLVDEQIARLKQLCEAQKLGGLIVPNFSIAAMLMMRFAAVAARYFTEVEIIETHHQEKFDAPSGTAMKTAEMIGQARLAKRNDLSLEEIVPGARGGLHHGVPIHSLRLPGFVANQQVIFGSLGESLSITHNSIDRASFMPGLILACERVQTLNTLYYGLETLLD
ncbi:MAG: 4-hydroxy-tetrahydrodipicolinate reductase [Tatlockia sp.]|nr:4-hydroxy-tetrahydrodipicolinate reductase [Tatlockia sp.]